MSQKQCLSNLPQDLIVEILSWVPVKHLLRFRCVSKTWKSIIFDPTFVKKHLKRSSKRTHYIITLMELLYDGGYDHGDTYAIPCSINRLLKNPLSVVAEDNYYMLKSNYWIIGSCNGLVCLGGKVVKDEFEEYWIRFWNPATRVKSKKSPCLHVNPCCQRFESGDCMSFGFVYDDSSETYMVVSVFSNCRAERTEVRIYCLGDNCWRKILSFPVFPLLCRNGKLVNGTINWLASDMVSSHYRWEYVTVDELVIFSLDLQKKTYRSILLPDGLGQLPNDELSLVNLRDCLCLFHDRHETHYVVWQMREFGVKKSWTLLVKVPYNHLRISCPSMHPLLPFCISENGDVLMLVNNDDLEVIHYNRRSNKVNIMGIPNCNAWWNATKYFQSLVSPC